MMPQSSSRLTMRRMCLALWMAFPVACGDDGSAASTHSGGTRAFGSAGGGKGEAFGIGGASASNATEGGSSNPTAAGSAGVAGMIISSICAQARDFTIAKTAALGCQAVGGVDVLCQGLIDAGCESRFRDLFTCVRDQPDSNWQCMMELGPVLIDATPCQEEMDGANDCVPPS